MPEQLPLQIDEKLYQNTIFEGLTPEQIAQVLPCIAVAVKYYGPDECIADPPTSPAGAGGGAGR